MPLQSPYRRTQAIANRLAGMSQPEAMRKAGFSPHYANAEAYRFFSRPEIKSRMTQALEQAKPGVVELAAKSVIEALEAEKSFVLYQGKDTPAEVVEKPDHDVRLKAVDRVLDAFGFVPGKLELPHAPPPPITVIFSLHGSDQPVTREAIDAQPVTTPFALELDRAPAPKAQAVDAEAKQACKSFVLKLKRAGAPNGSENG